jgi:hypothetical protein
MAELTNEQIIDGLRTLEQNAYSLWDSWLCDHGPAAITELLALRTKLAAYAERDKRLEGLEATLRKRANDAQHKADTTGYSNMAWQGHTAAASCLTQAADELHQITSGE